MNPQLYAPIPQYMRYYNIKQNDEEMEQATDPDSLYSDLTILSVNRNKSYVLNKLFLKIFIKLF